MTDGPRTRHTLIIVDKDGHILSFGCGGPDDCKPEEWTQVHHNALVAVNEAKSRIVNKKANRRGQFHSISYGISFGGGQKVCNVRGFRSVDWCSYRVFSNQVFFATPNKIKRAWRHC